MPKSVRISISSTFRDMKPGRSLPVRSPVRAHVSFQE